MAAQRLNSILLRSAFAGKWQMRSFQTLPCLTGRFVQLNKVAGMSSWINHGTNSNTILKVIIYLT